MPPFYKLIPYKFEKTRIRYLRLLLLIFIHNFVKSLLKTPNSTKNSLLINNNNKMNENVIPSSL